MRLLTALIAAFAPFAPGPIDSPSAPPQEAVDAELATKLDRYVELAKTGSLAVRPQAADRLSRMGAPAAERLLLECGANPAAMAAMGADLVEVLGRLDDPRLRAKLWEAVDDADFPWRPAAARSLAATPAADEVARFEALHTDRLAAVRVAAIGVLDPAWPGTDQRLRASLADEDDRVRRAAVERLHGLGESWALLWALEDLRRVDRFFDIDTGRMARFESSRVLRRALGDLFGYRAADGPDAPHNATAIESLEREIRGLFEGQAPALPRVARAVGAVPPGAIGLELRSCRVGELFFQWGPGDVLRVGLGNPRTIELEPGSLDRIRAAADAAQRAVGDDRLFGKPGCDLECLRLMQADGEFESFYMRKGPEAVPGLRPEALDGVARALVESLPPSEAELAARLAAALAAVGGAFDAPR